MMKIHYKEFAGKTILMTGAGSEIGHAKARTFLEHGAFVYGLDQQSTFMLQLKKEYPDRFAFQVGDVKDASVLTLTKAACFERFGEIDLLLNTEGIVDENHPLLKTGKAFWNELIEADI